MAFDEDTNEYVCDYCGRRFPYAYTAVPKRVGGKLIMKGKKQYLRLGARNNFKRHLNACAKKESKV